MGAGERVHIVGFAGSRFVAWKLQPIPRGLAGLEPLFDAVRGSKSRLVRSSGTGGALVVASGDRAPSASEDGHDQCGARGDVAELGCGPGEEQGLAIRGN